jgi:hypothetical protein
MPKDANKPISPWPASGGEYVLDGGEIRPVTPPPAPGCEADLKVSAEVEGTESNVSPEGQG